MSDTQLISPKKASKSKLEKELEDIKRRLAECEAVAQQYKFMYNQLEAKLKVLEDRYGNIQAVYDYMTQIGSTLVHKKASSHTFLNPMNVLEDKDLQVEYNEDK